MNPRHVSVDRRFVVDNLLAWRGLAFAKDTSKGTYQIPDLDTRDRLLIGIDTSTWNIVGLAGIAKLPGAALVLQNRCHIAKAFVFDQAFDELLGWFGQDCFGLLDVELGVRKTCFAFISNNTPTGSRKSAVASMSMASRMVKNSQYC